MDVEGSPARTPGRRLALAGGVIVAAIGMVLAFGLFGAGKPDIAAVDLDPEHLDGTGANALATTYQSPAQDLPAGGLEVLVEGALPAATHLPPGGVTVRLLCPEVEGWDHRRTVPRDAGRLRLSVPLKLDQPAACSFYVEVGGAHLAEPLRLRVR